MDLNIIWFILIGILYTGYFILEGFDMGVGILLPFLGKNDSERRQIINTIGPHWDGNEVWLITAGGATFAAFPNWYATLFSGFYFPLFIILVALIIRGVAFEFRSKLPGKLWRNIWDWSIFTGSLIPALMWGVAFSNILQGVPIDGKMMYTGGFWNLLNPYALLGGFTSLLGFILLGALFLSIKTQGNLIDAAQSAASRFWFPALLSLVVTVIATYANSGLMKSAQINPLIVTLAAIIAMLITGWMIRNKRPGVGFCLGITTVGLSMTSYFLLMFPRVMVSSIDQQFSLTIYNASSSAYTLGVITIIAVIFVPVVLVYQGWTYWIFRKRVSQEVEHLEY